MMYMKRFEGCSFIDLDLGSAETLAKALFKEGAGFAVTSEAVERRVYLLSETAQKIYTGWQSDASHGGAALDEFNRARCAGCGRTVPLNSDGRLFRHFETRPDTWRPGKSHAVCSSSGGVP